MFGIQRSAPSVVDFGVLMDTAEAVTLRGGRLKPAAACQRTGTRLGRLQISPADINSATRGAFRAALELYLGQENAAHALRLGGASADSSQPLMGAEIRQVLEVAHRIKKLSVEISQLKKIHIERLIARNAEDSRIVLMALDHGVGRDEMLLSSAAQARVDEAKCKLDAKYAELNAFLLTQRKPDPAH